MHYIINYCIMEKRFQKLPDDLLRITLQICCLWSKCMPMTIINARKTVINDLKTLFLRH